MDHQRAVDTMASSRYLTGDLSPAEKAAFEEHYFACHECAQEVAIDEIFAGNLRAVFRDQARESTIRKPVLSWIRLRPAFAAPLAIAACIPLAIVIYQNLVMIPKLRRDVAELSAPQALFPVALKFSRGIPPTSVEIPKDRLFFTPTFYLPQGTQFPTYVCDIENAAGTKVATVQFPAPQPGDPVAIQLLRRDYPAGHYLFKVRGGSSPSAIAIYPMELQP